MHLAVVQNVQVLTDQILRTTISSFLALVYVIDLFICQARCNSHIGPAVVRTYLTIMGRRGWDEIGDCDYHESATSRISWRAFFDTSAKLTPTADSILERPAAASQPASQR